MILQSSSAPPRFEFSRSYASRGLFCPCRREDNSVTFSVSSRKRRKFRIVVSSPRSTRLRFLVRAISGDSGTVEFANSARGGAKSLVVARFSDEFSSEEWLRESSINGSSNRVDRNNFTDYREDLIVDNLRTQLGVIHPLPTPFINRNAAGLFAFFFFVGVVFDNLWTFCKRLSRRAKDEGQRGGPWPLVPTSFSLFLEKDLLRKESVEWVNMVLEKLWKVYRGGIENWIIGSMQPVIDDLKKPDYVERVEIKQFSLGDEPLSVRSVERKTSRRVNDLQYQIGIRYTGGAHMLLMLSLKVGGISLKVPVSVRNFDIDGELWVKLRLIPSEPWVGAVSWAFVSLPKIKFELSLFRLLNLMAIPVLSMFLTKLLTEDLPRLFVRPKKTVLDFQEGKAVGPFTDDLKPGEVHERSKDYVGELSVTLVDAKGLPYVFYGKTDPYVILRLGDQVIRSKKNSQTTVFGPPGEPIWNQDFHLLVENPRTQKLNIEVNDCLGFTDLAIGTGEVDLGSLQDTVPTDRVVALRGGWTLFRTGLAGEVLLRLTYKAYVEDEEDDLEVTFLDVDAHNNGLSGSDEQLEGLAQSDGGKTDEESFMNVLSALIVSEEFQGIVSSEAGNSTFPDVNSTTPIKSSRSKLLDSESVAEIRGPDSDGGVDKSSKVEDNSLKSVFMDPEEASKSNGGSALLWFGVITGLSLLIALSMHFSSFFNP